MNPNFKFTLEYEEHFGLFRIIALRDFGSIKRGTRGGLIEREYNLSQEGTCWVSDNAQVCGDARVLDNARVYGNALISGTAELLDNAIVGDECIITDDACIMANARISDRARVSGNARIFGKARIVGNARVFDNATVFGNAELNDFARVFGSATVSGNALISEDASVYDDASVTDEVHVSGMARIFGSASLSGTNEYSGNERICEEELDDDDDNEDSEGEDWKKGSLNPNDLGAPFEQPRSLPFPEDQLNPMNEPSDPVKRFPFPDSPDNYSEKFIIEHCVKVACAHELGMCKCICKTNGNETNWFLIFVENRRATSFFAISQNDVYRWANGPQSTLDERIEHSMFVDSPFPEGKTVADYFEFYMNYLSSPIMELYPILIHDDGGFVTRYNIEKTNIEIEVPDDAVNHFGSSAISFDEATLQSLIGKSYIDVSKIVIARISSYTSK